MYWLIFMVGCADADTDPWSDTDTDTDVTPAEVTCAYPELAGDWFGDTLDVQGTEFPVEYSLTILPEVVEDEAVGSLIVDATLDGELLHCRGEFICIGRDQNEWRVTKGKVLPGSTATCSTGFSFMRAEQDGRMRVESGGTEFGPRNQFIMLDRVN